MTPISPHPPASTARDKALEVLAKWLSPQLGPVATLESDWEVWLRTLFGPWVSDVQGNAVPFAPHLAQIWEWFWSIRLGQRVAPLVAILPRGGAKSTSAELGTAALCARRARRYCLYICATQAQADDHIQNIGALLESPTFAQFYPSSAQRKVGKYGYSSGWNRQRLRTASGFTADAIGLDTAARGVKLEDARPDFFVFDDIDKELDTTEATEKKIKLITTAMLPAGSRDSVVLGVQNLVIEDGVFARLANYSEISKKADFLQNRIVIGPLPAIQDAVVKVPLDDDPDPVLRARAGKYTLISGKPIWEGQNLDKAQQDIDEWGITAWRMEAQQDVAAPLNGLFSNVNFEELLVTEASLPEIVRTVVWCDPAVTSTDRSDSHGVEVGSLGVDDIVYTRWSWEGIDTPDGALRLAIRKAIEYKADHVGVETDQGGDLWQMAYDKVWAEMVADGNITGVYADPKARIPFVSEKAGAGYGSKAHRASLMLRDYEATPRPGLIRHVINSDNTHLVKARALRRFPVRKPFDLTDASFWVWNDLKGSEPAGVGATDDTPTEGRASHSALAVMLHGSPEKADQAYTPDSDRLRVTGHNNRLWQGHLSREPRTLWRTPTKPGPDDASL